MERALFDLLGRHPALAIAACDSDGRLTFATPALARLLGQPRDAGMTTVQHVSSFALYDALGQRRLNHDETPFARALAGETVEDDVVSVRRPDGRTVHLRCSATPTVDSEGQRRGAVVMVQDVTVERMAEVKQAELRDRLVTTVNHELRTPLTKILGHVELLTDAAAGEALPREVALSIAAIARASHDWPAWPRSSPTCPPWTRPPGSNRLSQTSQGC